MLWALSDFSRTRKLSGIQSFHRLRNWKEAQFNSLNLRRNKNARGKCMCLNSLLFQIFIHCSFRGWFENTLTMKSPRMLLREPRTQARQLESRCFQLSEHFLVQRKWAATFWQFQWEVSAYFQRFQKTFHHFMNRIIVWNLWDNETMKIISLHCLAQRQGNIWAFSSTQILQGK